MKWVSDEGKSVETQSVQMLSVALFLSIEEDFIGVTGNGSVNFSIKVQFC